MSQARICPNCQAAIPADAPEGVCPACALRAGFEPGHGLDAPRSERVDPQPFAAEQLPRPPPAPAGFELLGARGAGAALALS